MPGALPWGGLALRVPRTQPWWSAGLTFNLPKGPGGCKLVFVRGDRLRTELSFEFRDLPLP